MAKDVPSRKYKGVYYRELDDGDRSYYLLMRIDGRQRRVSMGRRSEGVTEAFCFQQKAHIRNSERYGEEEARILQRRKAGDPTFRDLFNEYKENAPLRTSTRRVLGYSLRGIDFWDKTRVGVEDVDAFARKLAAKLKPATVNSRLNMLSAVFQRAIDLGTYRHENPARKVKRVDGEEGRTRYLSREEVDRLLAEVQGDHLNHLFVKLALCTGARISTLMDIRAEDVQGETIRLRNLKVSGTFAGFIDEETLELLAGKKGYVLSLAGPEDRPKEYQYQYRIQLILDRLFNEGVSTEQRVVIHTLRHTTASLMVQRGVPLHVVQKVLDHSSIRSTERYAKLHPDNIRDAVGKLWE